MGVMRLPAGPRALACLLGPLAAFGCSAPETTGPSPAPPSCVALYDEPALSALTPYPSNRYTVPDATSATGRRVRLDATVTADPLIVQYPDTAAQLSTHEGFSTTGGVIVKLSAPLDARGLALLPDREPPVTEPLRDARDFTAPGSPFFLVDVTGEAVSDPLPVVPTYWEQLAADGATEDDFTLIVTPAAPLRPLRDYLLVVTRALLAQDGSAVGASQEMQRVLRGRARSDDEAELLEALGRAERALGLTRAQIALATRFTTQAPQAGMAALARARRQRPAPASGAPFTLETPRTLPDDRVRLRATFTAPELRHADGKFKLDAQGVPETSREVELELFLSFSHASLSGPRPVVIYQHGLGGDKDGSWGTTERLAELSARGVAVVAIDSPEHGSRTTGATTLVKSVYGFFGIDEETGVFDIERARDNFRQMASDQLELVRFVSTLGSLDLLPLGADGQPQPDGVPDLDVSRLQYIGHSFGSVQGSTIMAMAPEIRQATWNVGGAGLMTLLRDSPLFSVVVRGLAPAGTGQPAIARFMAATQAIVDPGDPLNFTRFATLEALSGVDGWTPRDVLLQEVVDDAIVPNSSTDALARAGGLELLGGERGISGVSRVSGPVTSNLPGGATAVVSQFLRVEGGSKRAEHGALIFTPEARAQYLRFFQSGLAAEHATASAP